MVQRGMRSRECARRRLRLLYSVGLIRRSSAGTSTGAGADACHSKCIKSAVFGDSDNLWEVLWYPNSGVQGGDYASLYLSCVVSVLRPVSCRAHRWRRSRAMNRVTHSSRLQSLGKRFAPRKSHSPPSICLRPDQIPCSLLDAHCALLIAHYSLITDHCPSSLVLSPASLSPCWPPLFPCAVRLALR